MRDGLKSDQETAVSGIFDNVSGSTAAFGTSTTGTENVTTETVVNQIISGGDCAYLAGSPYNVGDTWNAWSAEAVISGGMWVVGSAGVLKPENVQAPFGVAKATTASGAVCEVLTRGPVYMLNNAGIDAGELVAVGSHAGMNIAVAAGAGSGARGICITGAASGTTAKALVYLY